MSRRHAKLCRRTAGDRLGPATHLTRYRSVSTFSCGRDYASACDQDRRGRSYARNESQYRHAAPSPPSKSSWRQSIPLCSHSTKIRAIGSVGQSDRMDVLADQMIIDLGIPSQICTIWFVGNCSIIQAVWKDCLSPNARSAGLCRRH
jgi:hypothetical protein